jgi:preprotein translocase subunit SecB
MDIKIVDARYFELSLRAVGKFEVSEELTEELKKTFINSNSPAIMFPYVRAFVTTLTSNLGKTIGTLWLPTQFFTGNLEEIHE